MTPEFIALVAREVYEITGEYPSVVVGPNGECVLTSHETRMVDVSRVRFNYVDQVLATLLSEVDTNFVPLIRVLH